MGEKVIGEITNLENRYLARIKYTMYRGARKYTISDIIDIVHRCQPLAVPCTIVYDKFQPLERKRM